MIQRHPYPLADLQGAATRRTTAAELLTAFAKSSPTLSALWRHLFAALDDIPALIASVSALRADLASVRYRRANLTAAVRATLAAHGEGEPDPLFYLRDELTAQHLYGRRRAAGGGR